MCCPCCLNLSSQIPPWVSHRKGRKPPVLLLYRIRPPLPLLLLSPCLIFIIYARLATLPPFPHTSPLRGQICMIWILHFEGAPILLANYICRNFASFTRIHNKDISLHNICIFLRISLSQNYLLQWQFSLHNIIVFGTYHIWLDYWCSELGP